jgi:hypothetical protein
VICAPAVPDAGTNILAIWMRPPRMLTSCSATPPAARCDEPIVSW